MSAEPIDGSGSHMGYQLQYRRCGNPTCRCRVRNERHGPFWYGYWREHGKVRSRYVGKRPPPGLTAEQVAAHEQRALALEQRRRREKSEAQR